MPSCGLWGISRDFLGRQVEWECSWHLRVGTSPFWNILVSPLGQRLVPARRKKETHKRQSKVESYSIEWSVYSSMQSRPVGISCLMPHALHFWPSLMRVYVSSRDANAAWNQALEHIHFFHNCCGNNRDNYDLISVHAPLIAMVFMTSKCIILHLVHAWNPLPLQF